MQTEVLDYTPPVQRARPRLHGCRVTSPSGGVCRHAGRGLWPTLAAAARGWRRGSAPMYIQIPQIPTGRQKATICVGGRHGSEIHAVTGLGSGAVHQTRPDAAVRWNDMISLTTAVTAK